MKQRAPFVLVASLALGACGFLTDVTLGAETLPAYRVDRTWSIQAVDLGTCPVGRHGVVDEVTGATRTLDVAEVPGGCELTFVEPDALLFDAEASRSAADALDGRRIESVQSAAVEVSGFRLTDGAGAPVDVGTVSSVRMTLDGTLVVDDRGLERLQAGETVRSELPQTLLDRILEGVNAREPVQTEVAVSLLVPDGALETVPDQLHLQLSIQPEVTVDVVQLVAG